MKLLYKKILPYILAFEIFIVSLFSCSIPVYAADFMPRDIVQAIEYGIEYNDWQPFWIFLNESKDGLVYLCSQMGAFVTINFQAWVNNNKALESLAETVPVPAKKEENNIVFTKDFMAELKKLLDDYAAQNQPFKVEKTYKMSQIPASAFSIKEGYNYFKSYFGSSYVYIVCNPQGSVGYIGDATPCIKEGGGFVKSGSYIRILDADWQYAKFSMNKYVLNNRDENGDFYMSVKENFTTAGSLEHYNPNKTNFNSSPQSPMIITPDGGNIRVFNTIADFINYSVGQRKIYYTSNYYDYVPEDLSVSIDDLQKTIEDMQDVIDKLLEQIGNDTSESEIEELLRKILEALENNPGGGGSGGGDVNVDIDLSSTNSLLSKILAKVTQIFDKMSGGTDGTGGGILQESLDAVLARLDDLNAMLKKYLSEITGDLDDIKGQLANMSEQEFEQKSDSFLGEVIDAFSEISEVVKTKFPFSIPNDLRIFLSKIAPAQSEAEAVLYLDDMSGMVLYSGEHGGNGTTDGETNPPGGGGASRPGGSGFVSVDHGGGGGSREPAEMREAPVFRLPIVIERYGIEEYIIIDMAPFDPLSRFSRSFFTIIFMVCLFNLTFKVIGMWGDIIG